MPDFYDNWGLLLLKVLQLSCLCLLYTSKLSFLLGTDRKGQAVVGDMGKRHHLLIAGRAGTGISGGIDALLLSLLYRVKPQEARFLLAGSQGGGLSEYDGIAHQLLSVITDPQAAVSALQGVVVEIRRRRHAFSRAGVKDWQAYNAQIGRAHV